jgi:light-regulated signal transduction histidine kinase (bacteriophytochrome)
MIERRRRRRLHIATHVVAALGLLLVAFSGPLAYRSSSSAGASVVVGLLLLATSHLLLTRELYRREHIEGELHDANRELEAFSYSVSHDLRAPLRSIAGFSQALIEDAGDSLSADARDDISRIVAAAQRMDHLINDLLTLSMVSRTAMTRDTIDISELAQKIVSELADVSPTREVSVSVAPDMVAHGDPRLVRVALENLLTNAWKFTSRREHATIEVGQASNDGSAPVFFVRDNGVGFDPTFADKLFGPFQRLHDAAEYPGTGIGLATVRRIVLRHGGRIWVEARMAKGACFYFTLQ